MACPALTSPKLMNVNRRGESLPLGVYVTHDHGIRRLYRDMVP